MFAFTALTLFFSQRLVCLCRCIIRVEATKHTVLLTYDTSENDGQCHGCSTISEDQKIAVSASRSSIRVMGMEGFELKAE